MPQKWQQVSVVNNQPLEANSSFAVFSTLPHEPLGGGQCHRYSHRPSRVVRNRRESDEGGRLISRASFFWMLMSSLQYVMGLPGCALRISMYISVLILAQISAWRSTARLCRGRSPQ